MEGLRLEIVTPDKVVLQADVDYVGAPGVDGEFGVLAGHISLLAALSIGGMYYKQGTQTHWAFVSGGFAEVADNKVTILAEAAELAEQIDVSRAQQAYERAKARLDALKPEIDIVRAQLAMRRALSRLSVAGR